MQLNGLIFVVLHFLQAQLGQHLLKQQLVLVDAVMGIDHCIDIPSALKQCLDLPQGPGGRGKVAPLPLLRAALFGRRCLTAFAFVDSFFRRTVNNVDGGKNAAITDSPPLDHIISSHIKSLSWNIF